MRCRALITQRLESPAILFLAQTSFSVPLTPINWASPKGWAYPVIKGARFLQRKSYRPAPGYDVVCCPANLNRALPNYIARMWMSDPQGNGLAATLYGPCKVTSTVGPQKTQVEIEEETNYPYSEEIKFRIRTPHGG